MGGTLDLGVVWNFAVAALIGALIGIDREKHRPTGSEVGLGGIRTFILIAFSGALSAYLSQQLGSGWIFVATLLVISAIALTGYVIQFQTRSESLGLTTEVAAVATFLLGGACLAGHRDLAVALGIVTSAVLAYKQPLHAVVTKIARDDIYAALKLLIATFVVLPLLPRRTLDPWGALNPYQLWLLVILISLLSLVGYVAVRFLGARRGTALTGLFGGLVSSTAVALSFARQSHQVPSNVAIDRALAAGLMLSWTVMFARIAVLVAAVYLPLLGRIVLPLLAMGLSALIAAAVLYHLSNRETGSVGAEPVEVPVTNPFGLTPAVKFAVFFAVVLLVVKLSQHYLSDKGLFVVAALAGTTDVDAISLSMATLSRDGGDMGTAVISIVIAALSNTVVKCAIVGGLATDTLRTPTLVATALVVASGAAAIWLI